MIENTWTDRQEKIIRGPYSYLRKVPGKDFRPQMIAAFNSLLKVDEEKLTLISSVIEMLHTSSLLIDDVEDNAELRRGYPVAHSVFGAPQTINSANYVYFVALQEGLKLNHPEVITIFTEELMNLHRGQGLDLYWRETLECPTEDEYLIMVMNKTGGLYRLAVRLMQAISDTGLDLIPLANLFGIVYQIQDDYLNLQSAKYTTNKGYCEDLTEGKFSFPIIHSIRADPSNKEILNILKQKTTDSTLKQYAVNYMAEVTKSFDYSIKTISHYEVQCRAIIDQFTQKGYDTSLLSAILDKMLSFLTL
ncbi:geranylgeranyl pyrophosphate synthase Bts1p [Trichomonascus vanleenenianus]|uniref:farnesyltranstransferase n=1 Tax=Trichomonascus vanleenenianus TaxID=2268995 RepID=UPI003ECB168E